VSVLAASKLNGKALMGVPSTLKSALWAHTGLVKQALWFSLAINLLMLAPTVFMMQVYDMVLNSQSSLRGLFVCRGPGVGPSSNDDGHQFEI
jgi:ABC-type protease/lipase transport system fused ATPase/permease subunit